MTLKQLEAFVRIANNKSFTLAAKELFITQPNNKGSQSLGRG